MSDEIELEQFEDLIARLEEIVRLLEGGHLTLKDSLSMYQEARMLSDKANRLLNQAEDLLRAETEA